METKKPSTQAKTRTVRPRAWDIGYVVESYLEDVVKDGVSDVFLPDGTYLGQVCSTMKSAETKIAGTRQVRRGKLRRRYTPVMPDGDNLYWNDMASKADVVRYLADRARLK